MLYLTITIPDISYAVSFLIQFLSKPLQPHFQSGIKILKYIKNAPGKGILYKRDAPITIDAYCDADWVDCPSTTRRSITGFCILIGGSTISLKSNKQSTISRSYAENEYRSMASTVYEIIWLHSFLKDLQVELHSKTTLHCDNKAAIHIASNPIFHERTFLIYYLNHKAY